MAEYTANDIIGILKRGDKRVISSRSMVGGVEIHRVYQSMTSHKRMKKGVG